MYHQNILQCYATLQGRSGRHAQREGGTLGCPRTGSLLKCDIIHYCYMRALFKCLQSPFVACIQNQLLILQKPQWSCCVDHFLLKIFMWDFPTVDLGYLLFPPPFCRGELLSNWHSLHGMCGTALFLQLDGQVYFQWYEYYCVGCAVQNVLSCTSECLFGGINHCKNWTTAVLLRRNCAFG